MRRAVRSAARHAQVSRAPGASQVNPQDRSLVGPDGQLGPSERRGCETRTRRSKVPQGPTISSQSVRARVGSRIRSRPNYPLRRPKSGTEIPLLEELLLLAADQAER